MIFYLNKLIFIHVLLIIVYTQTTYYISPAYSGCGSSCSGDITQPFDSLAYLFNMIQNQPNNEYIFILLPETTDHHYILSAQFNTSGLYYNYSTWNALGYQNPITIQVKSLTIKPSFCSENSSVPCVGDSTKITIFLKTEIFNVKVFKSLNIFNIIFDGSESISYYNLINSFSLNTNTKNCIYSKSKCCDNPYSTGISNIYSDVYCFIQNMSIQNISLPSQGLFYALYDSINNDIPSIHLKNSEFNKISLFNTPSLFVYDQTVSQVLVELSIFSNNFFIQGTIADNYGAIFNCSASSIPLPYCYRNITITDSIFQNYNTYRYFNNIPNFLQNSNSLSEGYVIISNNSAATAYSVGMTAFYYLNPPISPTNLLVKNSIFSSILSSEFQDCPSGQYLNQKYLFMPNTIDQSSQPNNARLDFGSIDYSNNYDTFAEASAFMFYNFTGSLIFKNNTFTKITGSGGSCLDIKNVGDNATFQIINNTFDQNFGFLYYTSVSIRKTLSTFEMSYACPNVIFNSNIVKNSLGCPVNYANIVFICSKITYRYLQAEQDFSHPEFTTFMNATVNTGPFINPYVTATDNIFDSNYISLSQGLSIYGFVSVIVRNNTFKNNGVLVENFGISKLKNCSFLDSSAIDQMYSTTFAYIASSPLFLSRNIFIQVQDNLFDNNWGVFSGDTLFASQMSLIHNFLI